MSNLNEYIEKLRLELRDQLTIKDILPLNMGTNTAICKMLKNNPEALKFKKFSKYFVFNKEEFLDYVQNCYRGKDEN